MFDEEESKKLRIFQRHERQELQLIIERCNEVAFDYVCVPSIRNDKDLCFGSKTPRKIHLYADDKTLNSFMRKCFKEHFAEPGKPAEPKKSDEEAKEEEIEVKPTQTHTFASRVPRFNDIAIDSTGVYRRRRKTRQVAETVKKIHCAFGSSNERELFVTRNPVKSITPGVGAYNIVQPIKNSFCHSFGGDIKIKPAYDIVCTPLADAKCDICEEKPRNIFWKNEKTQSVLCRSCYKKKLNDTKQKTRGVVERHRKLQVMECDYQKKRFCDFYHEHNKTTAAVRILTPKAFHSRIHQENALSIKFEY